MNRICKSETRKKHEWGMRWDMGTEETKVNNIKELIFFEFWAFLVAAKAEIFDEEWMSQFLIFTNYLILLQSATSVPHLPPSPNCNSRLWGCLCLSTSKRNSGSIIKVKIKISYYFSCLFSILKNEKWLNS